jgi:hypothetical protein
MDIHKLLYIHTIGRIFTHGGQSNEGIYDEEYEGETCSNEQKSYIDGAF